MSDRNSDGLRDLALWRTFLAAHRSGSVSAAARMLGLAQSSVTAQLQTLERHMGEPLFERHARGIRPTFRGVAYSLPADVRARTIDICAPGDPVCGVDPTRTTVIGKIAYIIDNANIHVSAYAFGTAGYPERAAAFLWHYA